MPTPQPADRGQGPAEEARLSLAQAMEPEDSGIVPKNFHARRWFRQPSGSSTRPHRIGGRQAPKTGTDIYTRSFSLYRIAARRLGSPHCPTSSMARIGRRIQRQATVPPSIRASTEALGPDRENSSMMWIAWTKMPLPLVGTPNTTSVRQALHEPIARMAGVQP